MGTAESLDFPDDTFDAAMASLVVHFMTDPAAGLAEMARVTRPGGVVAATVWNHGIGRRPADPFLGGRPRRRPAAGGRGPLRGVHEGDLATIFRAAGLDELTETVLTVHVPFDSFDQWWEPYTLGVGPAGEYVKGLDAAGRDRVVQECRRRVPDGPFTVAAQSWCVSARVADEGQPGAAVKSSARPSTATPAMGVPAGRSRTCWWIWPTMLVATTEVLDLEVGVTLSTQDGRVDELSTWCGPATMPCSAAASASSPMR